MERCRGGALENAQIQHQRKYEPGSELGQGSKLTKQQGGKPGAGGSQGEGGEPVAQLQVDGQIGRAHV